MSPRQLHRRTAGARERGAVLLQVALAMTVLCGFSALAVDYGLLMVARGQAQAAADAGALAGATTLAFDDFEDNFGSVELNARAIATENLVAQQRPNVTEGWPDVDLDANGSLRNLCSNPAFPPSPDPTRIGTCVIVSVHRTRERGNPLPTFFGRLVGVADQGVRASATAMMVPSNASECVWPLAIPDNWQDNNDVTRVPPTFVKYDVVSGFPTLATPADGYATPSFTPPSTTTAGTGFQLPVTLKVNLPMTLTPAVFSGPSSAPTSRGRFVAVQIPRRDGGGFANNLASCGAVPVTIGDVLTIDGSGSLATALAGASGRIAADPTASWNPTALRVEGSCAAAATPCAPMSPRVVVLPVFDLNAYEDARAPAPVTGASTGTPVIKVVNFVGFFITAVTSTSIGGQLTIAPGRVVMGKPMVGYDSAFLRTPMLSR